MAVGLSNAAPDEMKEINQQSKNFATLPQNVGGSSTAVAGLLDGKGKRLVRLDDPETGRALPPARQRGTANFTEVSMLFRAPAGLDDLSDLPDLRDKLIAIWNDDGKNGVLGRYVTGARARSMNYVDPRLVLPTTEPVKIPWNGFPRALSRWYDDELSTSHKEQAEAAAEITTPILSWVEAVGGQLNLRETEQHHVPFFGARAVALARPLRRILPDGTLGPELPRVRRQQDEYLEWHATRDVAGRLVALTLTAEPPDYWVALARVAPQRVLKLYRDLVGPQVEEGDLFFSTDLAVFGVDLDGQTKWFKLERKGTYDELNPWTTSKGIVHLTHRANTLGAEVFLAADASRIWQSDTEPPPVGPNVPAPEVRRIACGAYGGVNRSSDPLIGRGVGDAVKTGARVTLTDPIGLYIANPDISGLRGPHGEPIGKQALSIVRGQDDAFDPRILRFEVRLPVGTQFGLEDCTLDGRKLTRGGQVARLTTMHLYAQTYPGGADSTPQACEGRVCRHPQRTELFTIGDPNPMNACPDAQNLAWLLETPAEPDSGPPPITVHAAAPPTPQDVAAEIKVGANLTVARLLSTDRAPRKR